MKRARVALAELGRSRESEHRAVEFDFQEAAPESRGRGREEGRRRGGERAEEGRRGGEERGEGREQGREEEEQRRRERAAEEEFKMDPQLCVLMKKVDNHSCTGDSEPLASSSSAYRLSRVLLELEQPL